MLAKIKLYAIIGLLASSIALGGATIYLKNRNTQLNKELAIATSQIEKAKENLVLVSEQLKRETILKESALAALSELRSIPNEVYSKELDPALGSVIRSFNERVQR